jgi:hypothetical protein
LKNYIPIIRLHVREPLERRRAFRSSTHRFIGALRGQSMVEMIFTVLGVAVLIITAIEGSIIFNRGMAVKQLAYQGARYAAANPGFNSATVLAFVTQAEPSALKQGSIQVTMSPTTTPRAQGTAVSVSVSFTGPTMGIPSMISFPATIGATDVTMSQ